MNVARGVLAPVQMEYDECHAPIARLREHRVCYRTSCCELLPIHAHIRNICTPRMEHYGTDLFVEWPSEPRMRSRRRARACDVIRYSVRDSIHGSPAWHIMDRPATDICVCPGTFDSYRLWFTDICDLRDVAHAEPGGEDNLCIGWFLSISMVLSPYERRLVMSAAAARRPVVWATLNDHHSYEAAYSYDLSGVMPCGSGVRWFGNEPLCYNDMRVVLSLHPRAGVVRVWYIDRAAVTHVTMRGRGCACTRIRTRASRWRRLNCARIYMCSNEVVLINGAGSATQLRTALGASLDIITQGCWLSIHPRIPGDRWCLYDETWRAGSRPRTTAVVS